MFLQSICKIDIFRNIAKKHEKKHNFSHFCNILKVDNFVNFWPILMKFERNVCFFMINNFCSLCISKKCIVWQIFLIFHFFGGHLGFLGIKKVAQCKKISIRQFWTPKDPLYPFQSKNLAGITFARFRTCYIGEGRGL